MDPSEQDVEEFLDRIAPALLRAAWLITGDADTATRATTAALGRVAAGWPAAVRTGPVHAAYAALLRALPSDDLPLPELPPHSSDVRRRQQDCLLAFRELPRRDRTAVVLRRYADLGDLDVAHLLRMRPQRVDQSVAASMDQLSERGDGRIPPWDGLPVLADPPDRDAVRRTARRSTVSRRTVTLAGAAAAALTALGGLAWWARQPPHGNAALAPGLAASLPPEPLGRIFGWTRIRTDPADLGTVELVGSDGGGPVMALARYGHALAASVGPRLLPVDRTAWGWSVQVKDDRYAVVDLPRDTDGLWIVDPGSPAVQENPAWGVELVDHRTLGVVLDSRAASAAARDVVWRRREDGVGTGTGQRADHLDVADLAAIMLDDSQVVLLVNDDNNVLFVSRIDDEVTYTQYSAGGHRMVLWLLPAEAQNPSARPATSGVVVGTAKFGARERTAVLAVGPDFSALDQPLVVVTWTQDGRQRSRSEPT